ncbi:MAG: immune inhibitor A [Chloroflexi bacterium]|nr:immune inhibitor A [Chloroflexota bacterium]
MNNHWHDRTRRASLALVITLIALAIPALAQAHPPTAGFGAAIPTLHAQSTDPAAQVRANLESLGYDVIDVDADDVTALVGMTMVSGAFDEAGRTQIVAGWWALAQGYPDVPTLWSAVVWQGPAHLAGQSRYIIVFECENAHLQDWLAGRVSADALRYQVRVYDAQTDEWVTDKDFAHKNFSGAQPGTEQSLGILEPPQLPEKWLILHDDFTAEESGWETVNAATGSTRYADGEFVIQVTAAHQLIVSMLPVDVGEIEFAATAHQDEGDPDNLYGLVLRYTDADNFYAFLVNRSNQYALLCRANGQWSTPQNWTQSDAVQRGGNTLRVEARGARIALYANDELLTTVEDDALLAQGLDRGRVGLAAATFGSPPTTAIFQEAWLYTLGTESSHKTPAPKVTPTPGPSPVPKTSDAVPPEALETLQTLSQATLPGRDPVDLAVRFKGVQSPVQRVVNDYTPDFQVGDQQIFWVHHSDTDEYRQHTATLRYKTAHAYAWVENGMRVDQDLLQRDMDDFETKIYPTDRAFFGSEWTPGVDNDPRIHIFNGYVPQVGGYYSSMDEYPRAIYQRSNEKEMFFDNLESSGPGDDYYLSTIAHEFQHMIHWHEDFNEDTWVNEGFAELATYLNGYGVGGADYAFLRKPDTQLNTWDGSVNGRAPHYGNSYLFMTYFLDRFGESATRAVVARPENGIAAFDVVLKDQNLTFDDVFADWVIANYLNSTSLAQGQYGYQTLRLLAPSLAATWTSLPAKENATVHQYAADYIKLDATGDVTIQFDGAATVRVVGADPHSGQHVWWGNRGDDSDAALTREFDLAGVSQATLTFWAWYDIEPDFDYAYVEISADDGQTWTILKGQHTTAKNPNEANLGHGYTGKSGGGDAPQWVSESIDLTPYVGKKILVRFEYVTDQALNEPGFIVDDIAIPEIGYSYNAESPGDGWEAAGFVRIANVLPQRFIVQVIETGGTPVVHRMELDDQQRGQLTIEGLGGNKKAILIISGRTPFTTEMATYTYQVTAPN